MDVAKKIGTDSLFWLVRPVPRRNSKVVAVKNLI